MSRPKKCRFVTTKPGYKVFKPAGIPTGKLSQIILSVDELEAIRLADLEGFSQLEASDRMKISRATFGRIITRSRQIIAEAIIKGKAIIIEGGNFCYSDDIMYKNKEKCKRCRIEYPDTVNTDN